MNDLLLNDYDAVVYPNSLFPQTRPGHIAAIATLFELNPAPANRCRVLELGCGNGSNLISMAATLPESRFHGIDLAAATVRRGQELIRELGLANSTLEAADLLDVRDGFAQFDYIIAHGLYSWVPAEVRERIMALCESCLAPQGIAYISYNAYPGNHLRDVIRRIMRLHTQSLPDPKQKAGQARAIIKFAAEARAQPGLWQQILQAQLERLDKYTDEAFYHDDLNAINQPFYFADFMEHAARHHLQYLAESHISDMIADGFTEATTAELAKLGSDNVIPREQYLDFLKGRAFRQTLLCREELKFDRSFDTGGMRRLYVAGDLKPAKADADLLSGEPVDFQGPKNAVVATGNPVVKAAFAHLGAIYPLNIHFPDLLDLARNRAGRKADADDAQVRKDAQDLAETLVRACAIDFTELESLPSPFTTRISERPVASRLARLQIRSGATVSTLRHHTLRISDELGGHLLGLLDGTRDRAALEVNLRASIDSGAAVLKREGQPVTDPAEISKLLTEQLEASLNGLAKSGLLVA